MTAKELLDNAKVIIETIGWAKCEDLETFQLAKIWLEQYTKLTDKQREEE